ncbi:dihydrofolate reductase [[Acholeplasma] multilocale]|uniref:dihydrofolate reductase n=1 Tax=[Acholeplasma] multilocale TaxID=264638 RepID=UPI0004795A35|nr:dihydrofolate reductase [[Acholeplasma] multilocale]
MISLVWAQTEEGVIGANNQLPWSIKEEMAHFRQTTLNHSILMGSKTFESMNGKALPKRLNYVLTRDASKYQGQETDNLKFVESIDELVAEYKGVPDKYLYVIGGSQVFDLFFDKTDEIIRSIIKKPYKGDVYISNFNYNKLSKVKQIDFDEFYIEYYRGN